MLLVLSAVILLNLPALVFSGCDSLLNYSCHGTNVRCTTPTPTPNMPAITATIGALANSTPVLVDPLSQDVNNWNENDNCYFQHGVYVISITATSSGQSGCWSDTLNYTNAAIQADVTLISGYGAGIFFRLTQEANSLEAYSFEITDKRQFEVDLGTGASNPIQHLIPATASTAIHPIGQKNTLMVIANGSNFQFLINGVFVGETRDSTLTGGGIGFDLDTYEQGTQSANYSHLVVYSL